MAIVGKMRRFLLPTLCLLASLAHGEEPGKGVVAVGSMVGIHYRLYLGDGVELENNEGKEPLRFRAGEGTVLPALESALTGLSVGDRKTVVLAPEQAYGLVDPDAFQKVPLAWIPAQSRHPGAVLSVIDEGGKKRRVRVMEVGEEKVLVNFNHPLAGRTLTFRVEVAEVQ